MLLPCRVRYALVDVVQPAGVQICCVVVSAFTAIEARSSRPAGATGVAMVISGCGRFPVAGGRVGTGADGVVEAPPDLPGVGAGADHGVGGHEPGGQAELVQEGAGGIGDGRVPVLPALALVIVDGELDRFTGLPALTDDDDQRARRVVGVVGPDRGRPRRWLG